MRNDLILHENHNAVQIIRHKEKVEDDMLLNINFVILMLRHKLTVSLYVENVCQHLVFTLISIIHLNVILL